MVDDNFHKQMVYEKSRKSVGIAYLLWLFLGAFGVHRFYAGDTKGGVIQLVLAITVIGWLVLAPWLLIDLFLIPGLVRDKNLETMNMLRFGDPNGATQPLRLQGADPSVNPQPEPRPEPRPEPKKPLTEADRKRQAMLEELRRIGYKKDRRDRSLYR